jgi:hypothetical protein
MGVSKLNIFIKSVKKLMGWCPNAGKLETQHSDHPEYFEANNQSRGKNDGNPQVLLSSWRKKDITEP